MFDWIKKKKNKIKTLLAFLSNLYYSSRNLCRKCFSPKGHFVTFFLNMAIQLADMTSKTTFLTVSFETKVEALKSQGITFSFHLKGCWHQ